MAFLLGAGSPLVSYWWPAWWLLVVLLVTVSLESESSGFKGMGVADSWTWAVGY